MRGNLDKCIHDITLPRKEAVENMLRHCHFTNEVEWISWREATGRVLAVNLKSRTTLPNTLTASRDGVAVYYERFTDGIPDTEKWREGVDFVYANTGIGINGDFDTEILIESVYKDENGAIHFIEAPVAKGQNTIPIGNELKEGQMLAKAGHTLTPILLAQLARGGYVQLPVIKKPVVAFLPTGNELISAGETLPKGCNYDSNSILIEAKLREWGAEPLMYPICKDKPEEMHQVLSDAIKRADIVILNAGSSKGTDDFAHEVLAELVDVFNHQVDTGPGKHTCYALSKSGTPIIGISGPSGGCDYSSEWYVKPIIDRFLGRPVTEYPRMMARTMTDLVMTKTGVNFMMPAHVMLDKNGEVVVIASRAIDDNGHLENKVNCFVPMEGLHAAEGEMVEIELRLPFAAPKYEPDMEKWINKISISF